MRDQWQDTWLVYICWVSLQTGWCESFSSCHEDDIWTGDSEDWGCGSCWSVIVSHDQSLPLLTIVISSSTHWSVCRSLSSISLGTELHLEHISCSDQSLAVLSFYNIFWPICLELGKLQLHFWFLLCFLIWYV